MAKYRTKQRDELIDYFVGLNGEHTTAAEICNDLKSKGSSIGMATVYRQLDKLVDEGVVNKYFIDEGSSACFEYAADVTGDTYPRCYHMKCENCGRLIHLDCAEIRNLEEHVFSEHSFRINPLRTVFYGLCEECYNGIK